MILEYFHEHLHVSPQAFTFKNKANVLAFIWSSNKLKKIHNFWMFNDTNIVKNDIFS